MNWSAYWKSSAASGEVLDAQTGFWRERLASQLGRFDLLRVLARDAGRVVTRDEHRARHR